MMVGWMRGVSEDRKLSFGCKSVAEVVRHGELR